MKRLIFVASLLLVSHVAAAERLAFVVALPRAPLATVLQTFKPDASVVQSTAGFYVAGLPIDGDPCNPVGKSLFFWQVINSFEHPTQPSAAPSGRWRLWLVVNPDPADESFVRTAFRWLGRRRQSNPDEVVGPWTIPEFVAFIGNRTADDTEDLTFDGVDNPTPVVIRTRFLTGSTPSVPWVISGESPTALGEKSYAPSEDDIANDVDTP